MSYEVFLIIGAILVTGLLVYVVWRKQKIGALSLQTILVKLPQETNQNNQDPLSEINFSEQLFASLSGIKQAISLEIAVHYEGGEIFFYLSVPRELVDFTSRQIQAFFPSANIELATDYTVFGSTSKQVAGFALATEHFSIPFKTYRESNIDTFAPVLSTFSKLNESGDGASLQLILKPAPNSFKQNILKIIDRLKKGEKFKKIIKNSVWVDIVSAFNFTKKDSEKTPVIDEELIKSLQQKIAKPLFLINLRIVTASASVDRANDLLSSIAGSLSQFSAPLRNSFKLIKPRQIKSLVYDYIFREFRSNQALVVNSEELASFFHLPTSTTTIPRIKWLNTKEVAPPANLPADGVLLGNSLFRGDEVPVKLIDDDRRRHFYIIGQTGTGKSYLMLNMAKQDMEAGKGLCVIDPHGELVDKILTLVPPSRVNDVIVFDPGDINRPLGLNMLEHNLNRPEEKTFIVNEIQSIFNRLFDKETMGPMFEQYMRNALLLLMEDMKNEPATLMEVPRIFTDAEFRNKKLARINNPTVIDFWQKEASKTTGEQGLANMTPYITSKFGNFIANDYMRPIIGQFNSAFNFRQVMDDRKILLVNLAKGKIGDINAGLLGMIITGRLLLAALSRADQEESARQDFYLYIDEFQNFTTDSIATILSEARKYRLNLILAHQFINQLTDEIKGAVFGNVGSMASFRVGPQDAEFLVKQFTPPFSEHDLISIENQNAFIKLLIRGEPTTPFNLKTVSVSAGSMELRHKLKELSRLTYGRDLNDIERDILARLRQ